MYLWVSSVHRKCILGLKNMSVIVGNFTICELDMFGEQFPDVRFMLECHSFAFGAFQHAAHVTLGTPLFGGPAFDTNLASDDTQSTPKAIPCCGCGIGTGAPSGILWKQNRGTNLGNGCLRTIGRIMYCEHDPSIYPQVARMSYTRDCVPRLSYR